MNTLWDKLKTKPEKKASVSKIDYSYLDSVTGLSNEFKQDFAKVASELGEEPETIVELLKGLK